MGPLLEITVNLLSLEWYLICAFALLVVPAGLAVLGAGHYVHPV